MKLCIVYSKDDSKLREDYVYCTVFKDMFKALTERFECSFVNDSCSAEDIDAEAIFFFDPHSAHHIKIDGIERHRAIKIEYWNDLHQESSTRIHPKLNIVYRKLGAKERAGRALKRRTSIIITPSKYFFLEKFRGLEDKMMFFPVGVGKTSDRPYYDRKNAILGNGAVHGGYSGGYDFRRWAFNHPWIDHVEHWVFDNSTPCGENYIDFLSGYKAGLALCGVFIVPKYMEIPAAGCVTFAQYHREYADLGFRDGESCIYVDEKNFSDKTRDFLAHPDEYEHIAVAGKKLIEENYTARHFADKVYEEIKARRKEKVKKIPYEVRTKAITWMKKCNDWRANYDSLTYKDHQDFYNDVLKDWPAQRAFSLPEIKNILKGDSDASVLEIGGWKGDLANEILSEFKHITSWTNVEISDKAVENSICKDERYHTVVADDFAWNIELPETDVMILSHIIEHLKVNDLVKLINNIKAKGIYVEAPIKENTKDVNWDNYLGSHILEVGWDVVNSLFVDKGYSLIGKGRNHRIYRRESCDRETTTSFVTDADSNAIAQTA